MHADARAVLAAADARRLRAGRAWRSLAPARDAAHTLAELGDLVVGSEGASDPEGARAAAVALADLSDAIVEHFPENVFCDLDAVAGALAREARCSPAHAREVGAGLVDLHELYGRSTTIRFRYVHDFLYGFDWARWVAAAPAERALEPPFGRAFVSYSLGRGRELLALIEADDAKYHRLAAGETRSPFPFRRDPDSEAAILRALAADGAVPVAAWEVEPLAEWDRPYARLREAKARALGLALDAETLGTR